MKSQSPVDWLELAKEILANPEGYEEWLDQLNDISPLPEDTHAKPPTV